MKQRQIRGEISISEVGLGAWQLGADWAQLNDAQANEILAAALDSGVTFIDTADVYGAGLSEHRIGRFLKTRTEKVFVATKLGRLHGYPDGYSLELFRRCVTDSVERLGVEALDLVQLHCVPTAVLRDGAVFDWLRTLQQEGLIRNFGASVESTEEARICMAQEGLCSLQIIFNVFRQRPIMDIFEEAQQKNIALIVRLPLASGLLSGKFHTQTRFPDHDHRNYNRDGAAFNVGETFAGLPFEKAIELTEELRGHIGVHAENMAGFALRWILDHPAVSVVIPGATKTKQVQGNAEASSAPAISQELHQTLSRFFVDRVQSHLRGPV